MNNVQVNLNNGWNAVGFQSQQLTALTPGAGIAGAAVWNGSSYTTGNFDTAFINQAPERARRGFFVFNAGGPTSFTYSGNDDGQGNYVNVVSGYNLVSFCTNTNIPGDQITASVNGNPVPLNTVVLPQFFEIQPDNSFQTVDVSGGGSVKPGRAYWVFASSNARLNLPGSSSGLVVNPSGSATTVVGAQVVFTGTFNGAPTNLTIQSGNPAIAAVNGSTLQGVSVGVTNYTATANGTTVSGNITVQNGSLQSTLTISPGTALSVNEGDQRQFQAFANFSTSGNGTVQADVTNQVVWLVTVTSPQDLGEIISFDSGSGLFTATRGNGGSVQVGAIYSTVSAVATGNTSVTISRSNPTVTVRPAGSIETNNARIPGGGWSRLFEAVATYPSGYSKILTGNDVSWTNTASPAVAALNTFNNSAGNTGRAELVSTSVPAVGQVNLSATYTNSASGLASGTHTVGVITYTLQSTAAAFAPTLPGDKLVIPGPQFVRPVTVTATFIDKNNPGSNLVMPLFTNPTATNRSGRAGAISLYLNPGVGGSQAYPAGQRASTDNSVQLLTSAISAVGYTHLLRNVTAGLYNQNVLNLRVQYHPTTAAGTGFGTLSNSTSGSVAEVVGSSSALGGDRDSARTATLNGITLDGATNFQATVQTNNLRRGTGTNATLRAQYVGVGGTTEDVTTLADWRVSSGGANVRVANVTNGIGDTKGRVLNFAPNNGQTGAAVISAKYPRFAPGGDTANVTVNITLP